MSPQNLTNVYNQNPTLQGQYTLQQYLDLFGGSSTGTTTPTTNASGTGGTPNYLGNPVPSSNQGIINQNINQYQNQGGGGGITSARGSQQRVNDFNNAIAARQEGLNNPGKVQSFVNSAKQMIGIEPQMAVEQMLARSGYMNPQQRPTGGIPFGVGSAIAMAMPDKYYDMPLEDQIFTQSQMGYNDGSGYKDEFGYNTRSALGNYGEFVGERVDKTGQALVNSAAKRGLTFDPVTGKITDDVTDTNKDLIDDFNKKTSYIQKEFFSFTNKAKERKAISDRVANEKREQDARIAKAEAEARERAKRKMYNQQGRDNYSGPGMAFEARKDTYTGGKTIDSPSTPGGKYSSPRRDGGLMGRGGSRRKSYFDGGIVSLRRR